ncbi:MAG: transcription antitermination factor NusB [Flavobacteriales bacterium]|nr:transcription antitermination factor NusB [Bacteroidales bacterium AH-315-I05]PCJ84474.1 MAG: transcription antitermination factor NusB [Flavobacteriales bacterium]
MLNRRYLRVKVMQALYGWFLSPENELERFEREMFKSVGKIFVLYLSILKILPEFSRLALLQMEQRKEKRLPTQEDLNPNTKFIDNRLVKIIEENSYFNKLIHAQKISWQNEQGLIRQLFRTVFESNEYEKYMGNESRDFGEDKDFIIAIFKKYISGNELLHDLLEEQNIHWYGDIILAGITASKTLERIGEKTLPEKNFLSGLYKNENEDRKFIRNLFRETAVNHSEYEQLISEKASNWEIERIAVLDMLLMKMALCELVNFKTIPVKVTLNEYIELSKIYSTPKSKLFINGVLDKLAIELKASGKIVKEGRGLVE